MTGGRVKRIKEYIGNEPFMLTYGDGVSDVNIAELVEFHKSHGKLVTMSAYNPGQRFGVLDIDESGRRHPATEALSISAIWYVSPNSSIT